MRSWSAFSCFFGLAIFLCWMQVAEGRLPHFGQCAVVVDMQEVKGYFEAIKASVHTKDAIADVKLLDIRLLNGIQHAERCCFLRELLRFYLTKVFTPLEATNDNISREVKHLANSFRSMKLQLKNCRENLKCLCGEQTKNMMAIIEEQFEKLDGKSATLKGMSELNILIEWLKTNTRNRLHP
ncbi:interleukin-20-like [Ambystoma mexicanum]|uniref:interleukin-20-like n=1 Tax=Ambystoma mexicanum TaxID=8296 RepID=UPI0037E88C7D